MKTTVPLVLLLTISLAAAKPKTAVRWPIEHHQLTVTFDVENHSLEGTARLKLPRSSFGGIKTAGFVLNNDFSVSNASLGGIPVELNAREITDPSEISPLYGTFGKWDASAILLWTTPISKEAKKAKPLILQVDFRGTLYTSLDAQQFSHDRIGPEVRGTIGAEGIFLSSSLFWYPTLPDVLSPYEITVRLPEGWNCVTDGMPSAYKESDGWVEIVHTSKLVSQGISLSAGEYTVEAVDYDSIKVMTYFLPEQAALANDYLDASRGFIDMYSDLITPYPFPKFAIVDNFVPTGYGMPGWTLIGSIVLSNPHIRFKEISLGHEIAHNWFGNSLYVDYREGNWCEGLTVYLADYKYKEDIDSIAALEYRMNALRDFDAYVNPDNDYPVSKFIERSNPADRAIGYGKVMMIFHMLRKMLDRIDESIFMQVIGETCNQYRWQPIGWSTWEKEYGRRLGQKLGWFFDQWVNLKGAPEISIENVDLTNHRGIWEAKFEVLTKTFEDQPVGYLLMIRARSTAGEVEYQTLIEKTRQSVKLTGAGELRTLQLDPGFDVFRKIHPEETPLTLAKFFGDPDGVLVIPSKGRYAARYRQIANGLRAESQLVITDNELTSELEEHSLWLFGNPAENTVWERYKPDQTRLEYLPYRAARWREEESLPAGLIFKREESREGLLFATIIDLHPKVKGKTIVYSLCLPQTDPSLCSSKLSHYGKYSYLLFDGEENIQKGVWVVAGESPVAWRRAE